MPLDLFEAHVYRQELLCDCGALMKKDPEVQRMAEWEAHFYACPKCGSKQAMAEEYPQTIYVRKRNDPDKTGQ